MAREMKDSGIEWIGTIPTDWKILKNKYLFSLNKNFVGENFSSYQLLSLTTKGIKEKNINAIGGKTPDSYETYQVVKKCDLVMCLFDLDVSAVFSGVSNYDGMTSPAYKVYSCNDCLDSKFADRYFQFVGNGRKYMTYSKSLRYTINTDVFNEILSIIPPLQTQQRITSYLDSKCVEIDRILEKTKATINEYKKYKQSFITETVTKGINPNVAMQDSDIEWIGEIPNHWEKIKLRFLGILQNGISKSGEYFGTGFPFITYGDVYKNMILTTLASGLVQSTENEQELYSVQKDDVFFTRTSETIEEVGFSSTCLQSVANATFAGFVIRFRPTTNLLDSQFSKYYFRNSSHRIFFIKNLNIVTRASLSQELLKKMLVLLPPLSEQKEIAEYLDKKCAEIDKTIEKKQTIIKELESYKKSLIYECVTGKQEV